MNLVDLDERTREVMLEEFEYDMESETVYRSTRISEYGWRHYPRIFRNAIEHDEADGFAMDLKPLLEDHVVVKGKLQKVPKNAAELLAYGQFNYYYVRAMARRAVEEKRELAVYRAKPTSSPRPDSEAKIGTKPDPAELYEELRNSQAFESLLGIPNGPGSKISVRFCDEEGQ